ncbi:MAG: 4Fe-4S dicluster domain-containing protein [Candidatus Lokiarchaeota archaeon]|nr:4Fe-4S dicluster domain-containing protein [Candidatus Lokiarchaeota archaeon]MBD3201990.1 4Fe-4S dicluster domain-containing protein [Candidatus Lokiarchaeota archaeon]
MENKEIKEGINSCIDCNQCLEVCDTYQVSKNLLQSPKGRLKIAKKVLQNIKITEDERFGLYTCTLCGLCNKVCSQSILISEIIHEIKKKLANTPHGPYKIHKTIINGILEKDNSVNGNPSERLEWLPEEYLKDEEFENKESNTLLFLGCMSSFKVKESAKSAYELLKYADYDFKILKYEPCCGEYIYSTGCTDTAISYFEKVNKILTDNNIEKIIVTCAGCLYAFNNVYPKYIKDFTIQVNHINQILYQLEKEGRIDFNKNSDKITYHDSCRMGRKLENMTIYQEPRTLLEKCGSSISELSNTREKTPCCGAGSGVRGMDKNLCIDIGSKIFEEIGEMETDTIISSCPLCVFNLRYIKYKKKFDKDILYLSDFLSKSLKE